MDSFHKTFPNNCPTLTSIEMMRHFYCSIQNIAWILIYSCIIRSSSFLTKSYAARRTFGVSRSIYKLNNNNNINNHDNNLLNNNGVGGDNSTFWNEQDKYVYSELGLKETIPKNEHKRKAQTQDSDKFGNKPTTSGKLKQRFDGATQIPTIDFSARTNTKVSNSGNSTKNMGAFSLPILDVDYIGVTGRWVEDGGNFLLPPATMPPIGVIHFLGGAFVGAAPHISYRYLLEKLAEKGYLIVATPYRLGFDYIEICEDILSKFDTVAVKLANMYGPIPVIGLGHSCGALLQVLITSLFPDAPRAVNVLISFNNKPVKSSIPLFEELVIPISEQFKRDSDAGGGFREAFTIARGLFDQAVVNYASFSLTPRFVKNEMVPFLSQSLEVLDQVPGILDDIASGRREFDPNPKDTKEVCRRMYRARKTLLLKFSNDQLDESVEIEKVLKEANTIMRMKRPMIEMEVELRNMTGTHITPLTQNFIAEPPAAILDALLPGVALSSLPDPLQPIRQELRDNFLRTIDEVSGEILTFLDKCLNAPADQIQEVSAEL